jgi:hypothetical protein
MLCAGAPAPLAEWCPQKDKPLILGLIACDDQVVLRMLPDVQQTTIKPVTAASVMPGTLIHTEEYNIYTRLPVPTRGAGSHARPSRTVFHSGPPGEPAGN